MSEPDVQLNLFVTVYTPSRKLEIRDILSRKNVKKKFLEKWIKLHHNKETDSFYHRKSSKTSTCVCRLQFLEKPCLKCNKNGTKYSKNRQTCFRSCPNCGQMANMIILNRQYAISIPKTSTKKFGVHMVNKNL